MQFLKQFHDEIKVFSRENFIDSRGTFVKLYSKFEFQKTLGDIEIQQVNFVFNPKIFTFRGLHYQKNPSNEAKFVRVLTGSILDILLCIDKNSAYYGQFIEIEISEKNHKILYVPTGYAHGYITLCENTLVSYAHTDDHDKNLETGVNIFSFPNTINEKYKEDLIISDKDKSLPELRYHE